MKIKDCLACQMSEESSRRFLEYAIERILAEDEDWEKDLRQCAEDDPDTDWPIDFLEHMFKDHEDEYLDMTTKVSEYRYQIVKEVF